MKIITNHKVAIDSPDHLYPWGTRYNNHTDVRYIEEIENYFNNKKISFLDIGCAGGQFAVDFHNRGHLAVGIEGSDYGVKHGTFNWPQFHNKILFTCDAAKPYKITNDSDVQIKFDCISSWEVVEHIAENELNQFFTNITDHMHENSIFVGSISLVSDFHNGNGQFGKDVELHQSVFSKNKWLEEILPIYFNIHDYGFTNGLRMANNSDIQIVFKLTKK